MHKRAELNGILVSLENLTPGKLEQWLRENPQADVKEVKPVKKRIRRALDKEAE